MGKDKDKGTDILGAAGSIIGGLGTIGGWLGIGEGRQDRRQIKQQTKLNEVNAKTAKEMADYEQALKLKMWQDTNYSAMLGEANKAGVSKAAAIGGSVGGTTGASVGSVGGGSAADAASTTNARTAQAQAAMQLGSQIALQGAQKNNLDANTEKTKVETAKTQEDTKGSTLDNEGKVIANDYSKQTLGDRVKNIAYTAEQEAHKQQILFNERKISDATLQHNIKRIRAEAVGQVLNNGLTAANTGLTKERTEQVKEAIKQEWAEIGLKGRQVTNQELMDGARNRLAERGINLGEDALMQKAFTDVGNGIISVGGVAAGKMPTTETTNSTWTNSNGDWGQTRQSKKKQ